MYSPFLQKKQPIENLQELLMSSERGRLIIQEYNKNDILCDDTRNDLIQIIILEARAQHLDVNNTLFKIMAEKIEKLFSNENRVRIVLVFSV